MVVAPMPPAAQSRPQLGVEACAGPFQVAKTRGDGYVLPRSHHAPDDDDDDVNERDRPSDVLSVSFNERRQHIDTQ